MQSTIPKGASTNPFRQQIEQYVALTRDNQPTEYIRQGAYSWIRIPEQIQHKIETSLINVQKMLLPTLSQMRNESNIAQLQSRIYRRMKVYEDQFNACHLSCKDVTETYHCGNILIGRLNSEIPQYVKKVLDEY